MVWEGNNLKVLAKEKGVTIKKLSELLGVSRQTVNDWIKGQIPKGHHLVELCKILDTGPNYFFPNEAPKAISIPMHRKKGVAKLTDAMEKESMHLVLQYEKLFKEAHDPGLVRVLRIKQRDEKNATAMAKKLRELSGIESDKPIDYQHTFHLLSLLNIVTIFRDFPKNIKGYAFYCKIHKHRVVFVNNSTNVLDLIFPILHETIHAIRDEEANAISDPEEEEFCDLVANHIQFPSSYIHLVANTISKRRIPIQINMLKQFARDNSHSLFGIYEQIKKASPGIDLKIGGADTNLKKEFPTVGDILFHGQDPRDFINILKTLSPLFVEILSTQIGNATIGKFSEWLGLESTLDGKQVIKELKRMSGEGNI